MNEHIIEKRTYYYVFAALMALLAVTLGVAQINLGLLNWVAALTIAVVKASLVVMFFMHVRYGTHLSWMMTVIGVLWFLIMVVLTLSDYLARGQLARP
ncbi:caa(3)-type oxidase subunit IV [bacterium]|nr:caa(3)-type oxidase subunit IV [bacterium]